ncbi:hypothetical protein LLH23_20215 [bacterium]|nr:hypothetical protein [bacterium]
MRRLTWHAWIAAVTMWAGLGSLAAAPAPDFADPLTELPRGREHGAIGHGQCVTLRNGASWVRYADCGQQLPTAAGTIAVTILVDDDFQEGMLLSDAYERTTLGTPGTTWPSLEVAAQRAGPTAFRVSFGYCSQPQPDPDRWHIIVSPELPTGKWHDLAFSWGPHGQMLWVGDRIRAHSAFTGAYAIDPSTPVFRGWGLGCLYNIKTPDAPEPAPDRSAAPVSFRDLRLWRDQVWLGPRRQL